MSYLSTDPRRRGLQQQFTPIDFSTDWTAAQVMRAKSIRFVALSGRTDFSIHGIDFENPVALIELVGSKKGPCSTMLLMAFASVPGGSVYDFSVSTGDAIGTMVLPVEAMAGFFQIISAPNVYFRIGGDGSKNAVANEPAILQG
jgi:hypothetical protein